MKVQKKLVKFTVLLYISLLVLVLLPVSAAADEGKSGSLQMKTDRIIKGQNENTDLRQTELERIFPTLFTDETKDAVAEKDLENEKTMKKLEESIFFMDGDKTSTVQNVKEALFSEEYAAGSAGNQVQEESPSSSGLSKILIVVFAGIGILLFGGLYLAMRSVLD
ncbi:type VII secretion protein EssA [Oceanobacillus sp. FSL H7-0719]|uniref:type VII secretion protein EssA n=1 Tax=Oceanobacillus sp. FSL H7-0719 TaxID=2954507 RepID=UPI003252B27B